VDDDVDVDAEFDAVVLVLDSVEPVNPFNRSPRPQKDNAKQINPIDSKDRIKNLLR
jgi:hypothetical protein